MRRSNVRATTAATREKIMMAAETLMGERGLFSVSLREISAAAGQGNTNAAQYHFDNRAGLIAAIFEFRTMQFEPVRQEMLDRMAGQGRLLDDRCLVQCLCYPFVLATNGEGRFSFAGFMASYLTRYRGSGVPHPFDIHETAPPALKALRELVAQRLCFLEKDHAWRRMSMAASSFCNMLVRAEASGVRGGTTEFAFLVRDTVEQLRAALCVRSPDDVAGIFAVPGMED